jgi:predicted DNA-binding protein
MAKSSQESGPISVRLPLEVVERLKEIALEHGFVNFSGQPSMSTVVRLLVLEGLEAGIDEKSVAVWHSVKGMVVGQVISRIHEVLGEYSDTP